MRRAPFVTRIENDMYYADAALSQRLDLLLHLTQYGNELLLVTADGGGGKTSMLHQYLKRAQSNWSVGHITATESTRTEQFIKQVYRQFTLRGEALSNKTNSQALTATAVKKHLETYLLENRRVVLLIDDADLLTIDMLELVLELSTITQQQKSSLQIILFCHPQIKIKLAAPELEQKRFLTQRKIDLPKLNLAQTDNLLQHRLNATGLTGSKIFTHSAIKRIHKSSKGVPEQICRIAHQILTDSTPKTRHRFFNLNLILHPPIPKSMNTLLAALVIIILVAILYYQEQINALYDSGSNEVKQTRMELNIPTASNDRKQLDSNSVEPTEFDLIDQQSITTTPDGENSNSVSQTDLAIMANLADLQADTNATSELTNSIPTTSGFNKAIEPIAPSAPPTKNLTTPKRINSLDKVAISVQHQTKWLLSQKSESYTLQLLAGYNLSTIKNFLEKQINNHDKLAYYLSYNNGKPWHSLVYGIYPNRDTARLAIKSLPATLTVDKPWIRKLDFIKRDINDRR